MATATAANSINNVNSIGRCQICGSMRETAPVTFHRNVGMLVIRQTHRLTGNLCKTCIVKKFWDFTVKNLLLGPWGVVSLIVTPIYLVTNTVAYITARQKLRHAIE